MTPKLLPFFPLEPKLFTTPQKWFLPFAHLSKRCIFLSLSYPLYAHTVLLTIFLDIRLVLHSSALRPQPVSYLRLRNNLRSRSVSRSSSLLRRRRCVDIGLSTYVRCAGTEMLIIDVTYP